MSLLVIVTVERVLGVAALSLRYIGKPLDVDVPFEMVAPKLVLAQVLILVQNVDNPV